MLGQLNFLKEICPMSTYSQLKWNVSNNLLSLAANPWAVKVILAVVPFALALGMALLTANAAYACPVDSGGCTIGG
jgi:hypothetical protein